MSTQREDRPSDPIDRSVDIEAQFRALQAALTKLWCAWRCSGEVTKVPVREPKIGDRILIPELCMPFPQSDFDPKTRIFTIVQKPEVRLTAEGWRWTAHNLYLDQCFFADTAEPVPGFFKDRPAEAISESSNNSEGCERHGETKEEVGSVVPRADQEDRARHQSRIRSGQGSEGMGVATAPRPAVSERDTAEATSREQQGVVTDATGPADIGQRARVSAGADRPGAGCNASRLPSAHEDRPNEGQACSHHTDLVRVYLGQARSRIQWCASCGAFDEGDGIWERPRRRERARKDGDAWRGSSEDGSVGFDLRDKANRSLGCVTFSSTGEVEMYFPVSPELAALRKVAEAARDYLTYAGRERGDALRDALDGVSGHSSCVDEHTTGGDINLEWALGIAEQLDKQTFDYAESGANAIRYLLRRIAKVKP